MEELKLKWCTDLEDILQCPVCFERPQKPIYQCKDGHHICCVCRLKIINCPMCQGSYNGSRSFLAEHLALKLDEIQSSLLLPPVEKKENQSACTQTEDEPEVILPRLPQLYAAKGTFPCRLGKCDFDGPHSRILNHLRYYHEDRLVETESINGKEYSRQWVIDHISNIIFDLAFFIPDMGIFFLMTSFDGSGNFTGNVQIVHNNNIAREFNYKLEVKGNSRSCSYEGVPRSCRTNAETNYKNSLHISSQDMQRLVNQENKVTCIFTLTREIPEVEKKKSDL